jgi:inorganic pyrophosphatase
LRNLTQLPHELDQERGLCRAIIETPKGHRGKYDFDPRSGLFELVKMLPEGMNFPLDFGFVPSTLCDDGDPLDIMVMGDEPSPVGALLRVRLIGVLEAEQEKRGQTERNDRLLGIPTVCRLFAGAKTIEDLEPAFLENLGQFWINKAKLEGRMFRMLGAKGPRTAVELVRRSAKAAKKAA